MLAECHLLVVKNEKAKIKAMVATPRKKKKKKEFSPDGYPEKPNFPSAVRHFEKEARLFGLKLSFRRIKQ